MAQSHSVQRAVHPIRQRGWAIAVRVLFGLYGVGWLLAVIGISRDMRFPVDERWASSMMLVLQGAIAVLWIATAFSWQRALHFSAVVVLLAFAFEYIGVTTGIPFGAYHYTGALAPTILGTVPAPITLAWLMIALGSLAVAQTLIPRQPLIWIAAVSALLATGLDFSIEPTAYHLKAYWLWEQSGQFYGVPAINFLGWSVTAFVINGLAGYVLWRDVPSRLPVLSLIPVGLYLATMLMFATIDFFRGYPVGAAVGFVLACVGIIPAVQALHARQPDDRIELPAPSTHRSPASASESSSQESPENRAH